VKAGERLAMLRSSGLAPKKSFGQNFLVSDAVVARIAAACVPNVELGKAHVVELGAGLGALTDALVARAAHVTAVERDRDLVPLILESMGDAVARGALTVLEADAQTLDLSALFAAARAADAPRVLAGNLPYQITGQLLRLAVEQADAVDRVVFMVQAEVADRLMAAPSTKIYGALTVFVRAAYEVRGVAEVPPDAFIPHPGVSSRVVALTPRRPPLARETDTFRALVKGAFATRRKTLRNAWRSVVADGKRLEAAAQAAGISLDARGETLDVAAFVKMAGAVEATTPEDRPPLLT